MRNFINISQHLTILLVLLCFTACIPVDDFGNIWNQTFIDPNLEGNWLIHEPSKTCNPDEKCEVWTFIKKDNAYKVQSNRSKGKSGYPIKTLVVGHYRFLAAGPVKGNILRYEFANDAATIYDINSKVVEEFIKKNYPDANNISSQIINDKAPDGLQIRIKLFDDKVYEVLENIPNNGTYWTPMIILEKAKTDSTQGTK